MCQANPFSLHLAEKSIERFSDCIRAAPVPRRSRCIAKFPPNDTVSRRVAPFNGPIVEPDVFPYVSNSVQVHRSATRDWHASSIDLSQGSPPILSSATDRHGLITRECSRIRQF